MHDLHHLLPDQLFVRVLGIASGLDLSVGSLGEGQAENSQNVSIGGLGLHESLDEGVPLLDHRARLVSGDVHAIEVGVAVETFHLIALELQLSPRLVLGLVVAVSQRDGEHSSSQTVRGVLLTGSLVAWGQSDASFVETWSKHVVPLLPGEWMDAKQED